MPHAAGEVTQLHIGMLGTMAQLYVSELRGKTHRGLRGRVLAGRSAGGLAYGYRVTATGERAIEPSEAEVVRRIFRAFAAGQSPRAIADDPLVRDEAAEVLRELIEKVVLLPRADGKGLDSVLHGDLARILQLCEAAEKSGSRKRKLPGRGGPESQVSVVAGARNCLYLLLFAGALVAR